MYCLCGVFETKHSSEPLSTSVHSHDLFQDTYHDVTVLIMTFNEMIFRYTLISSNLFDSSFVVLSYMVRWAITSIPISTAK